MKKVKTLILVLAGLLAMPTWAAVITTNFTFTPPYTSSSDGSIDSFAEIGLSDTRTLSGLFSPITGSGFVLTLNVTGFGADDISGLIRLGPETETAPSFSFNLEDVIPNGGNYVFASTAFNDLSPNTSWNLFLWHNTPGFAENTLNSWSLEITSVPEPTTWAMIGFGVSFAGIGVFRHWRKARA